MSATPVFFRSNYTLLRGCRSPEEICRFARERSFQSVAMADINNFYGLIRFLKAARREGIRPVAGVRVEQGGVELLTALVLDRAGFGRACELLTRLLTATAGPGTPAAQPEPDQSHHGRAQRALDARRKPSAGLERAPAFDAVSDLATNGWEGLAILSDRSEVLERLCRVGPRAAARKMCPSGLFVKLSWGRPFAWPVRA